jgi:hypothetical protein
MFSLLRFTFLNEFQYPDKKKGPPCPSDDVWDGEAVPMGVGQPGNLDASAVSSGELFNSSLIKGVGEPGKLTATCA